MTGQHEEPNAGRNAVEGGEDQLKPIHHVWRRFPNTETACLKWVYSNYMTDVASTVPPEGQNAFDSVGWTTATALGSTGGGAWAQRTGTHILGVDGPATTSTSGHDFNNPVLLQLRMTTPYNILKTYSGTNLVDNAVANAQPNWLELFDTRYQFYHCLETEWEITFNFGLPWWNNAGTATTLNNAQGVGYYIFWKYTSNDAPPTSYTASTSQIANINAGYGPNVDAQGLQVTSVNALAGLAGGTVNLTPDDYFRMGGWHHKHVTLNSTHPTQVHINGKYKYGQCKMDIKTQEPTTVSGNALQTEGWLQSGSTYTFPEDLSVIIVQDNAMAGVAGYLTPVGFRMETEQLIQFKDLHSAYKFPTPANSKINSATTLNTSATFFTRGAAYT